MRHTVSRSFVYGQGATSDMKHEDTVHVATRDNFFIFQIQCFFVVRYASQVHGGKCSAFFHKLICFFARRDRETWAQPGIHQSTAFFCVWYPCGV